MLGQLAASALVSLASFTVHAVMTAGIVVATARIARRTDHLHVVGRLVPLLTVTMVALMIAHVLEIALWAAFYDYAGIIAPNVNSFEFAFENYTALGYGDAVPGTGQRLIGPVTSLNGLLLIGWSVAIIFEVMRMAEVQFETRPRLGGRRKRRR